MRSKQKFTIPLHDDPLNFSYNWSLDINGYKDVFGTPSCWDQLILVLFAISAYGQSLIYLHAVSAFD